MFWNFSKKTVRRDPEFIDFLGCEEFINSTDILSYLHENNFNTTIKNGLKFKRLTNIDFQEYQQKNIRFKFCLFLIDENDNTKNHDEYRGGDFIGKIKASKIKSLCYENAYIFFSFYESLNKLDYKSIEKICNDNFNINANGIRINGITEIGGQALKLSYFYANVFKFLSNVNDSLLKESSISFVVMKFDPNNIYFYSTRPNIVNDEISLESIKLLIFLNLKIVWDNFLSDFKIDDVIEKSKTEDQSMGLSFYICKEDVSFKKTMEKEGFTKVLKEKPQDVLNLVNDTINQIEELLVSIEKEALIITPESKEYLDLKEQNSSSEDIALKRIASESLNKFKNIKNEISQVNDKQSNEWDVIITF